MRMRVKRMPAERRPGSAGQRHTVRDRQRGCGHRGAAPAYAAHQAGAAFPADDPFDVHCGRRDDTDVLVKDGLVAHAVLPGQDMIAITTLSTTEPLSAHSRAGGANRCAA